MSRSDARPSGVGVGSAGPPEVGSPGAAEDFDALLPAAAIERGLGRSLREALDLASWGVGAGLDTLVPRVDEAVRHSVAEEERVARVVRGEVLGRLQSF